jgi:hypothetical protein
MCKGIYCNTNKNKCINEKFIDEDKKNTEKQVEKFTTEIKDLHTQINKLKVGILLRAFGLIAFVISTGLLVWQIVKK